MPDDNIAAAAIVEPNADSAAAIVEQHAAPTAAAEPVAAAEAVAAAEPADAPTTPPPTIPALSAILAESIVCPVCLNIYGAKIQQCRLGHSVCNSCFAHLTECPTCRDRFDPAVRNHTLEGVMAKLRHSRLLENSGETFPAT